MVNGIVAGAVFALIAIGLAFVYNVIRIYHFTHAVVFTDRAYFSFLLLVGYAFVDCDHPWHCNERGVWAV